MLRKLWSTLKDEGWSSGRGELLIQRLTPRVVCFVEKGHLGPEFAPRILEAMQEALQSPGARPFFFVDAELLVICDPALQAETTNWLVQNRSRFVCQHVLARSTAARLGPSSSARALGALVVGHTVRSSFEAAKRDAIERSLVLAAPP